MKRERKREMERERLRRKSYSFNNYLEGQRSHPMPLKANMLNRRYLE
jgi:hypothetical protein